MLGIKNISCQALGANFLAVLPALDKPPQTVVGLSSFGTIQTARTYEAAYTSPVVNVKIAIAGGEKSIVEVETYIWN